MRQSIYLAAGCSTPSDRVLAALCWQRGISRGIARMNDLPRLTLLEELDARQDELLAELDRLNLRLEQVIQQCLSERDLPAKGPLAKAA